jgi:hypothetical protein
LAANVSDRRWRSDERLQPRSRRGDALILNKRFLFNDPIKAPACWRKSDNRKSDNRM